MTDVPAAFTRQSTDLAELELAVAQGVTGPGTGAGIGVVNTDDHRAFAHLASEIAGLAGSVTWCIAADPIGTMISGKAAPISGAFEDISVIQPAVPPASAGSQEQGEADEGAERFHWSILKPQIHGEPEASWRQAQSQVGLSGRLAHPAFHKKEYYRTDERGGGQNIHAIGHSCPGIDKIAQSPGFVHIDRRSLGVAALFQLIFS